MPSVSLIIWVQALREAAACWGAPEVINTDQGSQFSSAEFVAEVARNADLRSS